MSDFNPTDLQAVEAQRAHRSVREKNAAATRLEDVRWLMSSARGRRIVWHELHEAGVFRTSFNTNSMTMAFAEGQRNAGLKLLDEIMSAAPEQYQQMVKEARK